MTSASPMPPADEQVLQRALAFRRQMHAEPEVGLILPRTQRRVADRLSELGIEHRLGDNVSSVIGVIRGGRPGPTVLLRADMDALAVGEDSGLAFSSTVPGAAHVCGHDLHTAGLIGAAEVLAANANRLAGNVLLMFQPGEEGHHGAARMIDEGLLDQLFDGVELPSRAFALHVNPWYELGSVSLINGPILAAVDAFHITLIGSAGHASAPESALDPVPAIGELIGAVQAHVARCISTFDQVVVSITNVHAGDPAALSAIPGQAMIAGNMRSYNPVVREGLAAALPRIAEGIAAAHGLTAQVQIVPGYPATVNDPVAGQAIAADLAAALPAGTVRTLAHPLMGSEDFSYVLQRVPGALGFVGTTTPQRLAQGVPPDNHSPQVHYEEAALATFVDAHVAVALGYLGSR